jgi:hypothetical protein
MLFHRLRVEAFCHATEDLNKVTEALLNVLPFEDVKFEKESYEGSFGNEILSVSAEFDKQQDIKKVLGKIKSGLPANELNDLEVGEHLTDDGEFWMRLDKQKAYEGRVALGGEDTIQIKGKVAAFPAKREIALKLMGDFWKD